MEPQIVDVLLPNIEEKVVDFKKTARVTMQGRNFSFRAAVLVGDKPFYPAGHAAFQGQSTLAQGMENPPELGP